jgi:hypothetical protein
VTEHKGIAKSTLVQLMSSKEKLPVLTSTNENGAVPPWVPPLATQIFQSVQTPKSANEEAEYNMLKQLILRPEMKVVWEGVTAYDDPRTPSPFGANMGALIETDKHFVEAAIRGFRGMQLEQRLPKAVKEANEIDLIAKAEQLAKLVEGTSFVYFLCQRTSVRAWHHMFDLRGNDWLNEETEVQRAERVRVTKHFGQKEFMSDVLLEFANYVRSRSQPSVAKPNDEKAGRAFFVRTLESLFVNKGIDADTRKTWVVTTTCCTIDEDFDDNCYTSLMKYRT